MNSGLREDSLFKKTRSFGKKVSELKEKQNNIMSEYCFPPGTKRFTAKEFEAQKMKMAPNQRENSIDRRPFEFRGRNSNIISSKINFLKISVTLCEYFRI